MERIKPVDRRIRVGLVAVAAFTFMIGYISFYGFTRFVRLEGKMRPENVPGLIKIERTFQIVVLIAFALSIGTAFLLGWILLYLRKFSRDRVRELVLSEEKFQSLLHSGLIGIVLGDPDGRILDANSAFLAMTGHNRADLEKGLRWDQLTAPEHRDRDQRARQELFARGSFAPFEKSFIRKDGSQIPVLVGGSRLNGSAGETSVFVIDLTERKKEQEHARIIKSREDLLTVLSHDLKNPLTSILANADLMANVLSMEPKPEVLWKIAGHIQASGQQMKRLIHDLLDLARIEAGKITIQKSCTNVNDMVKESIETLRPIADHCSVALIDKVSNTIDVSCDRERVLQVLSNLIGNAVKFSPAESQVVIEAIERENAIEIIIRDHGPGLSPEQLPHIFERYWQAKETARLGTGFGLSIAKGIIDAHGGKIWAESRQGHGSDFHFTLPFEETVEQRQGVVA